VTRNWDLHVDEEESEDLLSTIQEELRRRDRGAAVRLEISADAAPKLKRMLTQALKLEEADVYDVPGAFELPLAANYAARSGRYAGVACLGAVIRGETDHYDFVCAEAARGIQEVQLRTGVPCAFGVITCETMEQALARAGGGKRDQGRHAAEAVMTMAALRTRLANG